MFSNRAAPEYEQAKAPSYLLLGGMKEEEEVTVTEVHEKAMDEVKVY